MEEDEPEVQFSGLSCSIRLRDANFGTMADRSHDPFPSTMADRSHDPFPSTYGDGGDPFGGKKSQSSHLP